MPLSKAKMRERKRADREKAMSNPTALYVKPKWVVKPNEYLLGHLACCPDYDPERPGDHFEHCKYINPMLR